MQNEKLLNQIDFLNRENHRLNAIDYFHNHRCREEEVKRLDEAIANLTKDNEMYTGEPLKEMDIYKEPELLKRYCKNVVCYGNNGVLLLQNKKGLFKKIEHDTRGKSVKQYHDSIGSDPHKYYEKYNQKISNLLYN